MVVRFCNFNVLTWFACCSEINSLAMCYCELEIKQGEYKE